MNIAEHELFHRDSDEQLFFSSRVPVQRCEDGPARDEENRFSIAVNLLWNKFAA